MANDDLHDRGLENSAKGKAKDLKGIKPNPWDSDLWNVFEWSK